MSTGLEMALLLQALLLGVVEGLTEFVPVSSTGHLILLIDLLQFQGPPGKIFEIVIQLGAIMAVCWVYREKIVGVTLALPYSAEARRFATNIIIAVLPAIVVGVFAHRIIKEVLFSPFVVSCALILGGIAILLIEQRLPRARYREVESFPASLALRIGLCQVVAMIPGVSRSGASIMGGLLLGADRKAATEFSFFLAIPTMIGATAYDLYKNWNQLDGDGVLVIAVGFASAFLAALLVVRSLIAFVSRRGFVPFAWYRIGLGLLMLAILALH